MAWVPVQVPYSRYMALEELGWLLAIELEKKAEWDNCVFLSSTHCSFLEMWLFAQHLASSHTLSIHIYVEACCKRVKLFAST